MANECELQERESNWLQLPNLWLFAILSSFFLIYPMVSRTTFAGHGLDLLLSLSIILAVYAQGQLPRTIRIAYFLVGCLAVIASWLPLKDFNVDFVVPVIYGIFFLMSFSLYSLSLFKEQDVDGDTLLAAACAYILLGLLFSAVYMAISQLDPDAITFGENRSEPLFEMIYFSFVTLTSLGYGDILPVSPSAQMLAAYEAVVGQVFVTVVVAKLVGHNVARNTLQAQL